MNNGHFNVKHGLSRSPEYKALAAAIQRCSPRRGAQDRANYYDRGICVCPQWGSTRLGFLDFLAHIGPRPSQEHSLDRINNDRGYEPGNVRWATRKEQEANKRLKLRLEQFSDTELLKLLIECRKRNLL